MSLYVYVSYEPEEPSLSIKDRSLHLKVNAGWTHNTERGEREEGFSSCAARVQYSSGRSWAGGLRRDGRKQTGSCCLNMKQKKGRI